jgi:hypothetical protein
METTTTRAIYDLRDLMDEHLTTRNLVTQETGRSMRESIELRLAREPAGTVVALDFSHVGIIDFSCADEIISKLVARLQGMEYGDQYVVLHALTPTHEENTAVALERKKLAVLASRADGSWRLLGSSSTRERRESACSIWTAGSNTPCLTIHRTASVWSRSTGLTTCGRG